MGEVLIVGMGSLGGGELGYASDADVLFVHRPHPGEPEGEVQARVIAVVQELTRQLSSTGPDPAVSLDADLRPEGKNGPLVRSLDSYRTYYERWALTWEFQALLRAAPVAGSEALARDFVALIDPLRYREAGAHPDAGARDPHAQGAGRGRAAARAAQTPPRTSSWAAAGSPTSSGRCSCCSSSTPTPSPPCG